MALGWLLTTGCFSPSIGEGQYACGPQGSCPDGFVCREGRCARGDPAHACDTVTCGAHASCAVVDGVARCACDAGFSGDAASCVDVNPPILRSTIVNHGEAFARTPMVIATVSVEDATPPIVVRVSAATPTLDCQAAFADGEWRPYSSPATSYGLLITPTDGLKKVCAWARDALGNTSVIVPTPGTIGVDADVILHQAEHIPLVTAFEVVNDEPGPRQGGRSYLAGDRLRLSWTVTDTEGLAAHPVSIYATTEAVAAEQWTTIVEGYGDLDPGTTTYTDTYTAFTAPTTAPFRLKLVAADEAGNRSVAVLSDWQNTPGWSIYAGSPDRGLGGVGLSAGLELSDNTPNHFAIDPTTMDLYAVDHGRGIVRLDALTGLVERVFWHGTVAFPDDGPLPERPTINRTASIDFDEAGRLYLAASNSSYGLSTSSVIYQVDLATRRVRRYLGGGTDHDATATPASAFVLGRVFDIDEDNSLYFLTSCSPGSWNDSTSAARLMKLTQQADGSPGAITIVAGDCSRGRPPTGPTVATAAPLGEIPLPGIGSIAAGEHGRVIYYAFYSYATTERVYKVLDGQLYATAVVGPRAGGLAYNPVRHTLITANREVREYRTDLTDAGAETELRVIAAASAAGAGCSQDGAVGTEACVNAHFTARVAPDGTLLFMDGPEVNSMRPYRVRFLDAAGRLRTCLGGRPFHLPGLHRRLVRGTFAGIHYKAASAPNQTAFPAGLYFLDYRAVVLGHIDPATDLAVIDWGNESGVARQYATGATVSPDDTLGAAYAHGNAMALTFDADGLPWLRYGWGQSFAGLVRLDSQRRVVVMVDGLLVWEQVADGTSPASVDLWPFGVVQNLTLKDNALFVIGGSREEIPSPMLKVFDFGANTITRLMGGGPATGPAADGSGAPVDLGLSTACWGRGTCFTVLAPDGDPLYFAEENKVRILTAPSHPSTSTLGTLFSVDTGTTLGNFIFTPAGDQLLYEASGSLHCHDLTSGKSWCDDSPLGPPPPLAAILHGSDQLTFRDAQTLLISTYDGEIYEYTLPP